MWVDILYEKYDLLLPSKFEGGYLIISLYNQIKNRELAETFTTEDIRLALEEISAKYQQPKPQSERIIKNLLHHCLRNVPDQYGRFTLTEHAYRLVELLQKKLLNPYKNFPLRESFEKYFVIRFQEIKSLTDLETKFGRDFTEPYKRIILDHMESLEEEMIQSYKQLNVILNGSLDNATVMVKDFVKTFKKFGERAEDISESIASKDGFLRKLRGRVDEFYEATQLLKHPETEAEADKLQQTQKDWRRAVEIYNDLELFFLFIDGRIAQIRKHILKASSKLSELQENFSSRSQFRLKVRRLFHFTLEAAANQDSQLNDVSSFPSKGLVQESVQLFYPVYYDFGLVQQNKLIIIRRDEAYEQQEREKIERENMRQQIITKWIDLGIERMQEEETFSVNTYIEEIMNEENDYSIAQHVAIELSHWTSLQATSHLDIAYDLQLYQKDNFFTWKMRISKIPTAS